MTTNANFSWRDRSSELSGLNIHFAQIAAGGANYDAVVAAIQGMTLDIAALTYCTVAGSSFRDQVDPDSGAVPISAFAQREIGLRVFYTDDVTADKFHITIPGPELDNLTLVEGSDAIVLADAGIMATFVTAFETDGLTPNGNALTVTRAMIVGRHN